MSRCCKCNHSGRCRNCACRKEDCGCSKYCICQERTDGARMEKSSLSAPEWKNARTENMLQLTNQFLKMEAPLPMRSRSILRRNTMNVRSEGSRLTLKTVVPADQKPVTEWWSGTFHSLRRRRPLPPLSRVKWMEKPLPTQLNVATKRLCTGEETFSKYHQEKPANLWFMSWPNWFVPASPAINVPRTTKAQNCNQRRWCLSWCCHRQLLGMQ